MPGRKYSAGSGYRYGFNGKENDNEVKGEGDQIDYGYRIYDQRLGRFLSIDPLTAAYPYYTPYQFAGNSPIANIDLDGLEPKPSITGKEKEGETQTTNNGGYKCPSDAPGCDLDAPDAYHETQWNFHAGGVMQNNGKLSEAGWYNTADYTRILSPIASDLAGYQGLYSSAAGHNWTEAEKANVGNTKLGQFIGAGLSDNGANLLSLSARNYANNRNFAVSGITYPSSFNVEDMLGIGLGIKAIASITAKNLVPKILSKVVAGIEESALSRLKLRLIGLADRKYTIDGIKAFGSRTKGTYTVTSDVDIVIITNQAKEMLLDARINRILTEIKKDFYNTTKKELDLNIHRYEDIGPKTLFKKGDLKDF